MNYKYIVYEKREHTAYVTLNRPEVMNALHPPLKAELDAAWEDFISDSDLWVAILTGTGERAFSAGADLKYRTSEADQESLRQPAQAGEHILDRCWKPIIAAVNGYAVGGGLELALRCDIIVAAAHARFGLPEPRRGLLADEGGVVKLPRRIPYYLAMGMILTGKFITAQEAYRMGLVNEVVPMSELMPAAERWAAEVLECAPLALQAAKQAIVSTLDLPEEVALQRIESLAAVRRLRESEDYIEGPRAFAEKRKPIWKNR
ncbi:MAG: enoyl-CoA hydratase-related protein [Anaerolineae bacterium]